MPFLSLGRNTFLLYPEVLQVVLGIMWSFKVDVPDTIYALGIQSPGQGQGLNVFLMLWNPENPSFCVKVTLCAVIFSF